MCVNFNIYNNHYLISIYFISKVPGLFEGDEYATLMTQCKEGAQREGLMLDSADELYKWFTNQVRSEGYRQNVL